MNSEFSDSVSLAVALVAVTVAIWQVRASAAAAKRSNSLLVVSDAFKEFRSQEFRDHLLKVWNDKPSDVPEDGFRALPEDWRDSAYEVAYFFEYLGILVAFELVPKDLVLDFSANLIVRSWLTLEPFVQKEREYRKTNAVKGISPNFVSHFEHLAVISSKMYPDGKHVDDSIHDRMRLRKFP